SFTNLPLLISGKLFGIFKKNDSDYLSSEEFVNGLFNLYAGNLEQTQLLIFNLFDFDRDGIVIKEDIKLILKYIITGEENISKANNLINSFFEKKLTLSFQEYSHIIENKNSDIFFFILYYLNSRRQFSDKGLYIYMLDKNRYKECCIDNDVGVVTRK